MSDDAKKIVMARRARFVAAALAGMSSVACGKDKAPPPDESAITPMVCLTATVTQPTTPPDASADASTDASLDAASTTPRPCLTITARPPPPPPPRAQDAAASPRPCLDVNPPWDEKK